MQQAGFFTDLGPSLGLLGDPIAFVELHVEQAGRSPTSTPRSASRAAIWPHGGGVFDIPAKQPRRHDPARGSP